MKLTLNRESECLVDELMAWDLILLVVKMNKVFTFFFKFSTRLDLRYFVFNFLTVNNPRHGTFYCKIKKYFRRRS